MPFQYSQEPHDRKHGPSGYEDYSSYKEWLRDEFVFRCAYCLERERWYPSGAAAFGVDHVLPKSDPDHAHLLCNYGNLVYACNRCNSAKSDERILSPCTASFAEHLDVDSDGSIWGLTPEGRDLIDILGLDLVDPTKNRRYFLKLTALIQRYPEDAELRELYSHSFGFPDNLPDLSRLRPMENTKPEAMQNSYHCQRQRGTLPRIYAV